MNFLRLQFEPLQRISQEGFFQCLTLYSSSQNTFKGMTGPMEQRSAGLGLHTYWHDIVGRTEMQSGSWSDSLSTQVSLLWMFSPASASRKAISSLGCFSHVAHPCSVPSEPPGGWTIILLPELTQCSSHHSTKPWDVSALFPDNQANFFLRKFSLSSFSFQQ